MDKRYLQWLLAPVLGAVVAGLVAWMTNSTVKLSLTVAFGVAALLFFVGFLEARKDEKVRRSQIFAIFSGFVMCLLSAIAIWNVL